MATKNRLIDERVREFRRAAFFRDARAGGWIIALLTAVLVVAAVIWTSPVTTFPDEQGEVIGAHQVQREDGQGTLYVTVQLQGGQRANVALPRGVPILRERDIVLEVYGRSWLPGRRWYRFKSYADEANPSP